MAPEVAQGEPADARSDVFSCGAVLWELLVGEKLYQQGSQSNADFLQRIALGQVEPLAKRKRDVPRRLDRIVMRALSARPEDRHESARELGFELQELLTSKYRSSNAYELQHFLAEHRRQLKVVGFDDVADVHPPAEEAPRAKLASEPPLALEARPELAPTPPASEASEAAAEDPYRVPEHEVTELPDEVRRLAAEFDHKPSLWVLVQMGDLCAELGQPRNALACYRLAAVKFAQHGLLAQSILCAKLMHEQDPSPQLMPEIGDFPSLVGRTDETILPYLFRSGGPLEEVLARLMVRANSARKLSAEPPPLLQHLSRDGFAQLVRLAPVSRFEPGDPVVVEGGEGRNMYLILSGRVLVTVTRASGERVNVASLAAGEFFGENSFFSGGRRNATVEALEPSSLIEIDPPLYERIMGKNPKAASVLARFYKERIVDRILATASTFGRLNARERREVLDKLVLRSLADGTVIVRAGARCEGVCLVKRGAIELRDGSAEPVVLGPGSVFGEVEAVTGEPCTATAVAVGNFEAFVLRAKELIAIIDRVPARRNTWLPEPGSGGEVEPRERPRPSEPNLS
jgi:CRP-like cAMP-binding protein